MIELFTNGPVVIDNTVLSNFSKANCFYLIRDTLQGIPIITLSVKMEAQRHTVVKNDVEKAIMEKWLQVEELRGESMLKYYYALSNRFEVIPDMNLPKLGDGEAASLAYAIHNDCCLLTDDQGPRKLANKMGITVGGSISILYLANVEKRIINFDDCCRYFQAMKDAGANFPKKYKNYSDCIETLEKSLE
ncbi:hypothetical protein P9246_15640 [Aeribacillus pallidus]|nr:hypothetical protein [Aeribacillus composti]MED4488152.1 hypothetical protein [Aeribacillus pallidus]